MTNRLEPPLLDEHDHHLESTDGDQHHDHALTIAEEPLDPASQSLSDALRASFRVLKAIMLIVVVLFLLSGVYRVDQNEKVIVSHLGEMQEPTGPGLHWAWPYPIDQRMTIPTSEQRMDIDTFWFTLSDEDKNKEPSELYARGQGLDPATDGALLTGDHAIMNMRLTVLYVINDVTAFAKNVSEEQVLLKTVLHNSAVAEAARSTSSEVQNTPSEVAQRVRRRAQQSLDQINSGILLRDVAAPKSSYPLQAKDAFLRVQEAENDKRNALQAALSEQAKKLNGVAGEAWQKLYEQIQRLDQYKTGPEHEAALKEIDQLLTESVAGEAGGKIRLAQAEKQKVIADTQARVASFEALLAGYREHPELVREQQRQKTRSAILGAARVNKWVLPAGAKQVFVSLNQDPVQVREREREELTSRVQGQQPGR